MSAADEADIPCWVSVMSFLHRLLLNANTSSQLLGESAHLLTLVLWRKFTKKSFKRLRLKKKKPNKTNSWNLRQRLFFLTGSKNWNLSASLVTDWKLNQLVQTSLLTHMSVFYLTNWRFKPLHCSQSDSSLLLTSTDSCWLHPHVGRPSKQEAGGDKLITPSADNVVFSSVMERELLIGSAQSHSFIFITFVWLQFHVSVNWFCVLDGWLD